ncbi:SWIM-type domain-containing protein [Trichonephila clavipes]|nr:SWIM-type domain-containing protein [Trichonephila clavipes]
MDEILALERRTTGQNCSEWHLERKLRLTASDTKLIISRVADFKTLASQILKKKDGSLDFITAVKYGLEHEDYIRYIVQQRKPQNVVRQTGLVIHPLEQYITASPDGLIRSETGSLENKLRPGGRSKLTLRAKRMIVRSATNKPMPLAQNIVNELLSSCNVSVSAQTVRNGLHSASLKARTPRKKPYISEVTRKRRLGVCHEVQK